jgi:hypothetical protein
MAQPDAVFIYIGTYPSEATALVLAGLGPSADHAGA